MRTTLKLVLPLSLSVALVSGLFAWHQVRAEKKELRNELSRRAEIVGESLQESVEPLLDRTSGKNLQRLVQRFSQREHLKGVAIYDTAGQAQAITASIETEFKHAPDVARRAAQLNVEQDEFVLDSPSGQSTEIEKVRLHIHVVPLHRGAEPIGTLALFHDTSYIDKYVAQTLQSAILTAVVQTILITGLALILVRWMFTRPLSKTANWLRILRTSKTNGTNGQAPLPQEEVFDELHAEVTHLARDLDVARATAEEEAMLRDQGVSLWTAERLRVSLRSKLHDQPLFVVSNREPYMHVSNGKENSIKVIIPASGVVTALEPVLVACNGTWVANGSGSRDREVVDLHDRLSVPPDSPSYTLRRVWVTKEEDKGYYEGFSNEGLWPLCHIAHTRPSFRPDAWLSYQAINRRFADAVLQEMEGTESPILLAQDYHLALLPRMVKEARPDARVAIFWHIPWPNAEVFGICPWQRELLNGLLGADLIGFHIQTHCNNFLETVDRALEALTEWDRFAVNRQGHVTLVRPYPISVAFPENENGITGNSWSTGTTERAAICAELGIEASLLGVGVDRVDYTKGILERFRAIDRFLELNPEYRGRFTFVQIGAPSRTDIPRYKAFLDEVSTEAEQINEKFQTKRWKPIAFLKRHHSHQEIARYFRAASVCIVTSLHDGMNLVAKEFVASRSDEQGALILSTFAGAANELSDALLVNPYDVAQLSEAIQLALEMPVEEQVKKMQRMRKTVKENNVFRWAANLLSDLMEIRIDAPEHIEATHVPGPMQFR
jgi:trehalose-6-phosphate synthase